MSAQQRRFTVGTLILVGVVLLIAFDAVVAFFSWYVNAFGEAVRITKNVTQGNAGPFQEFANFLEQTWSWLAFVFSTPIAIAVIIVLSLIYEALEVRWK